MFGSPIGTPHLAVGYKFKRFPKRDCSSTFDLLLFASFFCICMFCLNHVARMYTSPNQIPQGLYYDEDEFPLVRGTPRFGELSNPSTPGHADEVCFNGLLRLLLTLFERGPHSSSKYKRQNTGKETQFVYE